jgi:hypothetical protein
MKGKKSRLCCPIRLYPEFKATSPKAIFFSGFLPLAPAAKCTASVFLIWGDPKGDFGMRVAHQQTEARNDPSVVGKLKSGVIAQPPSHDAQNRLNTGILRHNLDFFQAGIHLFYFRSQIV